MVRSAPISSALALHITAALLPASAGATWNYVLVVTAVRSSGSKHTARLAVSIT